MNAAELSQVLAPLWLETARSADALERLAVAHERMATALENAASGDDEEVEMGCPHPLEKRLALGTVGDGWQCACGYREVGKH